MRERAYTEQFWEALSADRFLIHACDDCEKRFFPPAPVCPNCHSRSVDWTESDGIGTLYSFTRQHATPDGFPDTIVAGVVELDDGPRLLTAIDEEYADLALGDRIRIEPYEYPHDYDRGRHSERPFFVATATDGDE